MRKVDITPIHKTHDGHPEQEAPTAGDVAATVTVQVQSGGVRLRLQGVVPKAEVAAYVYSTACLVQAACTQRSFQIDLGTGDGVDQQISITVKVSCSSF